MKSFLMATLFALPATLVTKNLPCVKKYLIQIASAGAGFALGYFGSDKNYGLSEKTFKKNAEKYGLNRISEKKKRPLFFKITDALSEPMLLILLFALAVAFGINFGKLLKTGESDFTECFGIAAAVILSVLITLFMEGSSERAFAALNKLYDNVNVKVIRNGETVVVDKSALTVGDVMILESGDKIVADGRIISSDGLFIDESDPFAHAAICSSPVCARFAIIVFAA